MRICYLADAQSPHTAKWAKHFFAKGHDVHVISFRPASMNEINVHHVQPPVLDSDNIYSRTGQLSLQKGAYLLCARKVRRIMQRVKPDIVHALLATSYGFVGAWAGIHPLVVSSLGSEVLIMPERSFVIRRLLGFNLKRANHITATSDFLANATARYCPPGVDVTTIPFGVDTETFSPRGRIYSDDKPLVIGTVKAMEQNYGIDRLIKVFTDVITARMDRSISLLIVGGGSLEDKMKGLGRRLGVSDRITFVGNVPHEKVDAYFDQIDIFVSLPLSEAFGVSAVEASACGIPSVVSAVGGLQEVVSDSKTGFLVDPMDTKTASSKILELVGSADLRRKMGKAARELVLRKYQWSSAADSMKIIYDELIREHTAVSM